MLTWLCFDGGMRYRVAADGAKRRNVAAAKQRRANRNGAALLLFAINSTTGEIYLNRNVTEDDVVELWVVSVEATAELGGVKSPPSSSDLPVFVRPADFDPNAAEAVGSLVDDDDVGKSNAGMIAGVVFGVRSFYCSLLLLSGCRNQPMPSMLCRNSGEVHRGGLWVGGWGGGRDQLC